MLIPTVLALSEFFSSNFPNISWYPYWYLGNPYQYLIGPVVPTILSILNIKDQISNIYLGLILGSLVLGGIGLYLFLKDWRVAKFQAIVSGTLYTVLPAGYYLLNYQNGLNNIAFGLLPFTLLLFKKFLVKENKLHIVFLTLTITIMFLTNVSILLPLVIGFIALFVSIEHKDYSREKIGKTILIFLLSLSLSTFWYTPKFWWVTIANPSVGGVPLGKLVWSIVQFLLQFLPIALAIFVVKLKKNRLQGNLLFGLLFFISFLFLSVVRFINDPDFVMDWTSFGLELQFGGAILGGHLVLKVWNNSVGRFLILGVTVIVILFNCYIVRDLFVQQFNNLAMKQSSNNYKNSIISMLKKNVKDNERVFLSGSPVFFINSKLNIAQVRGGLDQSSINPIWADAAYQIREDENVSLAHNWLRALGVTYVLVHDKYSDEPFHDFKYPRKFSSPSGFVILACPESPTVSMRMKSDSGVVPTDAGTPQNDGCEYSGDKLYKVNNASIVRVADASILNVQKPKNGADERAINNYILSFKRPLEVNSALQNQKPNEIIIEGVIKQNEVISLSVSYDNLWKMVNGKGVIRKDALGNMVIIPKNTGLQKFKLVYNRSLFDLVIPLGLSIVILIIFIKYQKIYPKVKKRFSKLTIGLKEEDY